MSTECGHTVAMLGKGLNSGGWSAVEAVLQACAARCTRYERHEDMTRPFDLGIFLGYDRIVPAEVLRLAKAGCVLFHSSDLPAGRGWAPVYNTITRSLPLTQTLLFAADKVDSGPVIAKARYQLVGDEVEAEVRGIDDRLTLLLLEEAIRPLLAGAVVGRPQDESKATWWDRRAPEDSQCDPARPLAELVAHLRAVPDSAPAFLDHQGRRYALRIEPMGDKRRFDPERVVVERCWNEWG